jgi:HKD family nuclease
MTRLIWNAEDQTIGCVLEQSAPNALSIQIAVAFLSKTGWSMVRSWLQKSLERGCQVELFVGTDFYQTDPSALRAAEELLRNKPNSGLWIYKQNLQSVFHPKIYLFRGEREIAIVLGSANLTAGGLRENREICCYFSVPIESETAHDVNKILESYRSDRKNIKRATVWDIGVYEGEWSRFHIRIKKAEHEAIKEIKGLPKLQEVQLRQYLQGYHRSDLKEYQFREQNYAKIPDLLDQLMISETRAQFIKIYGALVSSKGRPAHWYSGGLFRRKNQVADGFKDVCKMVQTIREHPNNSSSELFSLGQPYVKRVFGLGVNVLTEVMHSYYPDRCPVLNNNSLGSLRKLTIGHFPEPQLFEIEDYHRFTEILDYLRTRCGFHSMGQVDHFLNYVYQNYVKSTLSR